MSPEVSNHDLSAFPLRAIVRNGNPLCMTDHISCHDIAIEIADEEAFCTGDTGKMTVVLAGHPFSCHDLIGMILRDQIAPQHLSVTV